MVKYTFKTTTCTSFDRRELLRREGLRRRRGGESYEGKGNAGTGYQNGTVRIIEGSWLIAVVR
jgi:hypothetical protein